MPAKTKTFSIRDHVSQVLPTAAAERRLLFLDLETRSELDVTSVGARVYAEHPSTEILCISYAIDNDPVQCIERNKLLPFLARHQKDHGLFCAHNIEFEYNILRHVAGLHIPFAQWLDTAALARYNNLPGNLEQLGAYVGVPKDLEGRKVMMKLSKPRRPSKTNPDKFWTPETKPEDFHKLYRYCNQDVETMRAALSFLAPMPSRERRLAIATNYMNERGVRVDTQGVQAFLYAANQHKESVTREFEKLTGFSPTQVKNLADFTGLPSVDKAHIRDALDAGALTPTRTRALELRQEYAKTSTAKLDAFLRYRAEDGRIHDLLVYGGAERTLRWAGFGIQPQNFPRGAGKHSETIIEAAKEGLLPLLFDDPLAAISEALRSLLVGPFLIGDYSQIEARILAWLVGEKALIEAFATGADPYKIKAAEIYRCRIQDVTPSQRFMGKQVVLACGFQMGHVKFRELLANTYGVFIDEEEAQDIVSKYRESVPKIAGFWRSLQKILRTLWNQRESGKTLRIPSIPHLEFSIVNNSRGDYIFEVRLPSGRKLRYHQLSLQEDVDGNLYGKEWKDRQTFCFYGRVPGTAGAIYAPTVYLHGGILTGHIVQSIARDMLSHALLNLHAKGFELVLTVHDEIVAQGSREQLKAFTECMLEAPPWLQGAPIGVDSFYSERYRK